MSASSFALLLDPRYKRHDTGHGHPERAARYDAVGLAVERSGVATNAIRIEPRKATVAELELCHGERYIAQVEHEIAAGVQQLSTGDTAVSRDSYEVAIEAVGGVLGAVDAVVEGRAKTAFCAVRPPGHHARPSQGMGFCLFNNIAVGARYAQSKHGLERVLIVDWDVHHGNGTQDIFYSDPTVLFFSTHQSPWYPGTGAADETGMGKGAGTTINRPFPAGSGRRQIHGAFKELAQAAKEFRPDLVMISAGFDSRSGDPLGDFTLLDPDFADLTNLMRDVAEASAGGRVISSLEGGYDLDGLSNAAEAHLRALAA